MNDVTKDLLEALKLAECVYRKNVVNEGEPSSVLEAMQAAITAAEAQLTDYSSTVDRARARFCGAFGDGPDAPYPGMIAAFETHYGQSFRDKEWRTEAACWAAAWSKATARAEAALAEHQPDAGLIARDDVNRMARESGLLDWALHDRDEKILRFAHLVIADFLQRTGQYVTNDASREAALEQAKAEEREACLRCYSPDDTATDWADRIRARGQR